MAGHHLIDALLTIIGALTARAMPRMLAGI